MNDQEIETLKIAALAAHLDIDAEDISHSSGDEFDAGGLGDWLVCTDTEADEYAEEQIRETLWAFNAEFLAAHTPEGVGAEEIESLRGDRCESANPGVVALVEAGSGMESLIEDAIGADGRGHFIGSYDFEEHESGGFFLYRVN